MPVSIPAFRLVPYFAVMRVQASKRIVNSRTIGVPKRAVCNFSLKSCKFDANVDAAEYFSKFE